MGAQAGNVIYVGGQSTRVLSTIGLVVFFSFELFFVLAAVGFGVLLAKGQELPPGNWPAAELVFVAGAIGGGMFLAGRLRAFTRIEIAPDGGWRLSNALGIPLGNVVAGAGRQIQVITQMRWNFVGSFRRYEAAWLEIDSAGRRFHSWVDLRSSIEESKRKLDSTAIQLPSTD